MTWADTRYHPEGRCAFCNARSGLRKCWIASTRARAWRCEDDFECIRRLLAEKTSLPSAASAHARAARRAA